MAWKHCCCVQVTLGGEVSSVTSIKECQVTMQGLSIDEVKMCLDVEASVSMGISAKLKTEAHHCKHAKDKVLNEKSFASNFND
ncbi:perforin-1-like, partial [Clarias magur]